MRFRREVLLALGAMLLGTGSVKAAEAPNVLIILADDLGYGDLGCTGSTTIRTPHIDALAKSGVFCTRGYVASAVCSPSRAGLITGRDPRRFGYEANLNKSAESYPTRPELLGLPPTENTIGDQLGTAGYQTAVVGKWHLGLGPGMHPNRRGFDYFCGMLGGGHTYFPAKREHKIERNGERIAEFSNPYLTDFFTDEAIGWIDRCAASSKPAPWFLYLSYNAPHTPLEATEEDLADYAAISDPKRRTYAAMVSAMDRGVGRVIDHLTRSGQRENTMVVFLSDNGGATDNASWNGPLSGAKGSLREGGIRVPMIWSWPAKLPAGVTSDAVVSSLDILPTALAASGANLLPLQAPPTYSDSRNVRRMTERCGAYDGKDVVPLLAGESAPSQRRLYWHLQGQAAVLRGERKLVRLNHRGSQLFDTAGDPGERNDLASSEKDARDALARDLAEWEATLPTVPLWDSSPYWWGASAQIYDEYDPSPEPGSD